MNHMCSFGSSHGYLRPKRCYTATLPSWQPSGSYCMSLSRAARASSRSCAQSGICYSNRSYLSLTGGYWHGRNYGLSCACGPGHPRTIRHCHGPLPYFGRGPRSGNYALSFRTGAP